MKADNTELEKAVQWFDSRPLMEKMMFAYKMNRQKYAELPDSDKLHIYLNRERFYKMCDLDNSQYNAYRASETRQPSTPEKWDAPKVSDKAKESLSAMKEWLDSVDDTKPSCLCDRDDLKQRPYCVIHDGPQPDFGQLKSKFETPESVEEAADEYASKVHKKNTVEWHYRRGHFRSGAKWQSVQSPSTCKESQGDIAEFKSIVEDLATWSKKYPRSQTYSFNEKIDEQLIALEERAKELIQKFEPIQ